MLKKASSASFSVVRLPATDQRRPILPFLADR